VSELNVPEKFASRETEFRAMTRKWIEKKHAAYTNSAKHLKDVKPIRHPKGAPPAAGHSVERLWADSIWCQDSTLDPFEEFFDVSFFDDIDGQDDSDDIQEWANLIFNDEFTAVLPELAHVLEG
jgi:hypothetical protein